MTMFNWLIQDLSAKLKLFGTYSLGSMRRSFSIRAIFPIKFCIEDITTNFEPLVVSIKNSIKGYGRFVVAIELRLLSKFSDF